MLRVSAKKVLGTTSCGVRVPARLYHERVADHYDNLRNVGSLDKNDPSVDTGAPACGDVMKLQITDPTFKPFGCISGMASSIARAKPMEGEVFPIQNTIDVIEASTKKDYEAQLAMAREKDATA